MPDWRQREARRTRRRSTAGSGWSCCPPKPTKIAGRDRRQQDDPPAVGEPVAPEAELARACSRPRRGSRPGAGTRCSWCSRRGTGSAPSRSGTRSRSGLSPPKAVGGDQGDDGRGRPTSTGRDDVVRPRDERDADEEHAQQDRHRVSVLAAFFASGGLNAGTPLAIASMPVSATEPLANARRSRTTSASRCPAATALRLGRHRHDRRRATMCDRRRSRRSAGRGRRTGTSGWRRCCPTRAGRAGCRP